MVNAFPSSETKNHYYTTVRNKFSTISDVATHLSQQQGEKVGEKLSFFNFLH